MRKAAAQNRRALQGRLETLSPQSRPWSNESIITNHLFFFRRLIRYLAALARATTKTAQCPLERHAVIEFSYGSVVALKPQMVIALRVRRLPLANPTRLSLQFPY